MKIKKVSESKWKTISKGIKMKTVNYNVSEWVLKQPTVNAHIRWERPDDLSKENLSIPPAITNNFLMVEEDVFLIYRQLMLEAGYFPTYCWVEYVDNPFKIYS